MDPNANLKEQRGLVVTILKTIDRLEEHDDLSEDAERLAELVQALDEWLSGGGFLPKDWNRLCKDRS